MARQFNTLDIGQATTALVLTFNRGDFRGLSTDYSVIVKQTIMMVGGV